MGTRGLTAVIKDGSHKIAQYGQWDHYPSGQGVTILAFLRGEGNIDKLEAVLPRVRFLTNDEYDEKTHAITGGSDWVTSDQSEQIGRVFPFITRNHGGGILEALTSAPEDADLAVFDNYDFAKDGLFCEYAYVVDLDTRRFEVYVGFQGAEHTDGRFAGMTSAADFTPKYEGQSYYAPVRLVASYPLDALPDDERMVAEAEGVARYYAEQSGRSDEEDYEEDAPPAVPGPIIA